MLVVSVLVNEAEASNSRSSSATQSVQGPRGYMKPCHKKETNLIRLAAHVGNPRVRGQRQGDHCKSASLLHIVGLKVRSEEVQGLRLGGPGDSACPVPVESEPTLCLLVPV